jgi:hypothetical protein
LLVNKENGFQLDFNIKDPGVRGKKDLLRLANKLHISPSVRILGFGAFIVNSHNVTNGVISIESRERSPS